MIDKVALLGKTKKLPKSGSLKPHPALLRAPLSQGGAIRYFCTGCGSCYELTAEGASELLSSSSFAHKYVLCDGCIMCGDKFENPHLVAVP